MSNSEKPLCRHFSKGNCRHGLLGKTQRDDVESCPFMHPKVCMKWINNGTNTTGSKGCLDKTNCPDYHPLICKFSLLSRTCPNIEGKNRCMKGYHLKGIIYKMEGSEVKDRSTRSKTNEEPRNETRNKNVSYPFPV